MHLLQSRLLNTVLKRVLAIALLLTVVVGGVSVATGLFSANQTVTVSVNSVPFSGQRCPLYDGSVYTIAKNDGPWQSYALSIQTQKGKSIGEKGFDNVVYGGDSLGDSSLFAAQIGMGQRPEMKIPSYGDPTPYAATYFLSWVQVVVKGISIPDVHNGCVSNVAVLTSGSDSPAAIQSEAMAASESWWANGNNAPITTTAARVLTAPMLVKGASWVTTPYQGEQLKMVNAFHDRSMTGQLWTLKLTV